jgi:hypothetical protein
VPAAIALMSDSFCALKLAASASAATVRAAAPPPILIIDSEALSGVERPEWCDIAAADCPIALADALTPGVPPGTGGGSRLPEREREEAREFELTLREMPIAALREVGVRPGMTVCPRAFACDTSISSL